MDRRRRAPLLLLSLLLTASTGAMCAGTPAPEQGSTWRPVRKSAYRIGPADLLLVRVWKNPELTVEAPVRPDGKISVPLLGEVQAEGLTTEELEALLFEKWSEYVADPEVTVVVRQIQSKNAYVLGEVVRSGPITLQTDLRVLDALSVAGGFTAFADKRDVKVIRQTPEGEIEFLFDYEDYVDGKAPGTNILLQPGDTIVVPD